MVIGLGRDPVSETETQSWAGLVGDVPAERLEEGIARESPNVEVRMTNGRASGQEDLSLAVEEVDQTFDGVGCGHSHGSEGYARGALSQGAAGTPEPRQEFTTKAPRQRG
jgi:hypothetical protein